MRGQNARIAQERRNGLCKNGSFRIALLRVQIPPFFICLGRFSSTSSRAVILFFDPPLIGGIGSKNIKKKIKRSPRMLSRARRCGRKARGVGCRGTLRGKGYLAFGSPPSSFFMLLILPWLLRFCDSTKDPASSSWPLFSPVWPASHYPGCQAPVPIFTPTSRLLGPYPAPLES